MSFWSRVQITEAWVVKQLHAVENGIKVAEKDAAQAVTWILDHYTQIATDVTALIGVAAVTGADANPAVMAALEAANKLAAGIAAFKAKHDAGARNLDAAASAYSAAKAAQIAHAGAATAIASAKAPSGGSVGVSVQLPPSSAPVQ
jgi:hypothetical protein